jgi:hypothetical protein
MVIKLVFSSFLLATFADYQKKAEPTEGSSFGSSAILSKDPPFFALSSRSVEPYRMSQFNYYFAYQKMLNSSIEKRDCENYLFKNYRLKSGITIWILILKISGIMDPDSV